MPKAVCGKKHPLYVDVENFFRKSGKNKLKTAYFFKFFGKIKLFVYYFSTLPTYFSTKKTSFNVETTSISVVINTFSQFNAVIIILLSVWS